MSTPAPTPAPRGGPAACSTCQYYSARSSTCHFYPPAPSGGSALWVPVQTNDWCGQWVSSPPWGP